ncbi:MAG: uncharacterized protein KVP18_004801 [Porospora cf. gigantea A]|uniref:uncharacterized protein n=1 Tax=Porospora cf. gigantea A TaxID=2853593 RepID=UPI003559409C|nr:MAG: hypothetical protein KVP18_004801 [Porospora cf. gigantea A]
MAELSFPDLESEVAAVTSCMGRLRQASPDGTLEGLMSAVSVKEGAKLNLVLSLVLMSVEFSMLRFHGLRPADSPCTNELTRVKSVYRRYQELSQKESVEGMQPRVDKAVAGRLVQFHTSQAPDPEQVKPADVEPSTLNDTKTKVKPSVPGTQSSDSRVSSTSKRRPTKHDGAKVNSVEPENSSAKVDSQSLKNATTKPKVKSPKGATTKPKDTSVKAKPKGATTKPKDTSVKAKPKGAKTKRLPATGDCDNHLKPQELVIELSDDALPNTRKRGRPPVKHSKRRKTGR